MATFKANPSHFKAGDLSENENCLRLGIRGMNRFTRNPECMSSDNKDPRYQNMRDFILKSHDNNLFNDSEGNCFASATAQKCARQINHPDEFLANGKAKRLRKSDLEQQCTNLAQQVAKMNAENEALRKQINDMLAKVSGQQA